MSRLADAVAEFGTIEQDPKVEGGSMTMVLAPVRRIKTPKPTRNDEQSEE